MQKYTLFLCGLLLLTALQIPDKTVPQINPEQAQIQYDKALKYYGDGEYEPAIEAFKKGIALLPKDTLEAARYYANIGFISAGNLIENQYNQAIIYYEKAIILKDKNNVSSGNNCKEVGRLYALLGEYSKSERYYERAIPQLAKELDAKNTLALAYVELGQDVYRPQGRFDEAIQSIETAKKLWKINENQSFAIIEVAFGNVYYDNKQYQKAINFYQEALKILRKRAEIDNGEVAKVLNNIGTAYSKLQEWTLAANFLSEALNRKLELGTAYKKTIASSYNNIGTFYLENGKLDTAILYYQHAIELITDTSTSLKINTQNIDNQYNSPTIQAMKTSIDQPNLVVYLNDKADCLIAKYQQSQDEKYLKEAYKTYQTIDDLIHLLLDNLTEESQMIWIGKVRNSYENAIRTAYELYQIEKDKTYLEAAFNFAESNKAVVLYKALQQNSLKSYEKPTNILAQIQEKLNEKEVLIEYFVGEVNTIYIFQITKKNISLQSIQNTSKLRTQIHDFNAFVGAYERDNSKTAYVKYLQNAFAIYKILVKPVAENANRLIIIPDDNLYYISFVALLTEKTQKETISDEYDLPYLIKKHEITYGFSTAILLNNVNQTKKNVPFQLKIYAPDFEKQTNFASLLGRKKEVEKIKKMTDATVKDGFVSVEELYKKDENYAALYFATHGKVSGDSSYLVFSDRLLSTNDIYEHLDFSQQLVVLGACETGIGELKKGEGVMSLTRALMYKGSPNVISSLWKIDDEGTGQIIANCFGYLKNGKSSVKALHLAQLNYLDNPNRHHPKYWAALTHSGAWSNEREGNNWRWKIGALLIGLLCFGSLLYFWK